MGVSACFSVEPLVPVLPDGTAILWHVECDTLEVRRFGRLRLVSDVLQGFKKLDVFFGVGCVASILRRVSRMYRNKKQVFDKTIQHRSVAGTTD